MKRQGGVSVIPCTINGLRLSFIFDTGASDVSISLTEALFMLKNGYLTKDDILGTANYSDATGEISEGVVINLKEIEIGGLKVKNVKASIVKNTEAPLLLGQSALQKLGRIELDFALNTIKIFPKINRVDGTVKSVTIADMVWAKENLNVSHFQNGDSILEVRTDNDWKIAARYGIPAWCYYDNDSANGTYGKIYNWYAVIDPRGLAPNGWHVASRAEWQQLIDELDGEKLAHKKIKSKTLWNGENSTGFNALPGGCRYTAFGDENFDGKGRSGFWWSSTKSVNKDFKNDVYGFVMHDNECFVNYQPKEHGLYVRCVMD